MRWRWLAVSAPLGLGVLVASLAVSGLLPNHLLYLQGDVATLSWLGGLLLSSLAISYLLFWLQAERNRRREVAQVQDQATDEHRRFLRRLDHELKNPLTAIRAGLANLAWVSSKEAQTETLSSVETQALRLSRLAADLRKLAELETRPLEHMSVNVADLLQEVWEVAQERPEAAERQMTLTVPQAPWPLPDMDGDRDLLFLAVHNLADNALKFSAPGDTVEIRAFEDGATVVIEVADTGPGIPEEEIPHLWKELYRGQGAQGVQGSGLGLALVRAIIERHGGQTGVRSRVGQGTVFTLQLPLK